MTPYFILLTLPSLDIGCSSIVLSQHNDTTGHLHIGKIALINYIFDVHKKSFAKSQIFACKMPVKSLPFF